MFVTLQMMNLSEIIHREGNVSEAVRVKCLAVGPIVSYEDQSDGPPKSLRNVGLADDSGKCEWDLCKNIECV
jgi:hypothetical protein